MKNSAIVFLLGASLFLLCSCMAGTPLVDTRADNNQTYNVQYLFEHEGCKVYRFYDRGNYVYFTNSAGTTTAIKNDSTATYVRTLGN